MLEDVGLKQRIFADLEKACRPDCILSTNTSTIDISLIGQKTRAADRIVWPMCNLALPAQDADA